MLIFTSTMSLMWIPSSGSLICGEGNAGKENTVNWGIREENGQRVRILSTNLGLHVEAWKDPDHIQSSLPFFWPILEILFQEFLSRKHNNNIPKSMHTKNIYIQHLTWWG